MLPSRKSFSPTNCWHGYRSPDGITNSSVCDQFKCCNVYSHEECADCFAKLYCSGGCAANAHHTTGSITGVYDLGCQLHKKRIECAIMLKVAEMCEDL